MKTGLAAMSLVVLLAGMATGNGPLVVIGITGMLLTGILVAATAPTK
jgi:hypothetical protein